MSAPINTDRFLQRYAVWTARKANPDMPVGQLARLLGMPESSVRRSVKLLETPAKAVLEAGSHDAVSAWLQAIPIASLKGDHRPAKDLLLHTRAIEPVQLQGQTQIQIIFAGAVVPGLLSPDAGQQVIDIPSNPSDSAGSVVPASAIDESRRPDTQGGPGGSSG